MFGFQPLHLVVIFLVALIIFGPQRLPEIGRGLGKASVEFRRGARELSESFQGEINAASNAAPWSQSPGISQLSQTGNFCIHCGAPNPGEARFCNQCGSSLPAAGNPQPEREPGN